MEAKEKKYEIWQPFLLAAVLAGGMIVGTQIDDQLPIGDPIQPASKQSDWAPLINAVRYIDAKYGDTLDVDSVSMSVMKQLISHLDPHSYFLDGTEYNYFQEKFNGEYQGIGIEYEVINDSTFLTWTVPDAPADEAGLKAGDIILSVDEVTISGEKLNSKQVYEAWKKAGDPFSVRFMDAISQQIKTVELKPQTIQLPSVPLAEMINSATGYIRINRFAQGTYGEFMQGLESLVDEGCENLVIDVRNNPGGALQEVIKILDQLTNEKDQLMLYMAGRKVKRVDYTSTGRVFFPLDEIYVLINEHSVSASEVLAGVLQDLGRAKIIGRRSYGKALVQETFDLGDQTALNLSIGRYYLPGGRFIQRKYDDLQTYRDEIDRRAQSGELFFEDSLDLSAGNWGKSSDGIERPIGEGVIPDYFIPADSFEYTSHWRDVRSQFNKSSFRWSLETDSIDDNWMRELQGNDVIVQELWQYLPGEGMTTARQHQWKEFLWKQAAMYVLWHKGKESYLFRYGQDFDSTLEKVRDLIQ